MFDLKTLRQIKEVENETNVSATEIIRHVPIKTTLKAFQVIHISDLITMVKSVPLTKLIHGLQIIDPIEIEQIPVDKLKIVLKHGNMTSVAQIQSTCGSRSVIIAIKKMTNDQLISLLDENNVDAMISTINQLAFVEGDVK